MKLCINPESTNVVKTWVKQLRKVGFGEGETISQQLANGAEIKAMRHPFTRDGMMDISYITICPDKLKMVDTFEASIIKGKPKHKDSKILSDTGNVFFSPGKKDF